jgi:hypothetical protein
LITYFPRPVQIEFVGAVLKSKRLGGESSSCSASGYAGVGNDGGGDSVLGRKFQHGGDGKHNAVHLR